MAWNSLQFMQHLNACGNRYEAENCWFGKKSWGEQHRYALNAWRLYRLTLKNSLGMLLLGSAKIRKDQALIASFGLASGGGITDPEEVKIVQSIEAQRKGMREQAGQPPAKVLGSGSILNDKDWSPLLNDCYIIGGVHGGHEFHLAEDSVDAHFTALDQKVRPGGKPLDTTAKWVDYFRSNPGTFWDDRIGVPRILAREMVGLKAFGYRATLKPQQLSFTSPGATDDSFQAYLDAIVSAGIVSKNRTVVLDSVSKLLFGTADALRGI